MGRGGGGRRRRGGGVAALRARRLPDRDHRLADARDGRPGADPAHPHDPSRAGRPAWQPAAPDLAAAAARIEEEIDLASLQASLPRLFDKSLEGLQRIRAIVGNLRDFASLDEAEFKDADLNAALTST